MACGDPENLMHLQSILFDQKSPWSLWWLLLNLAHSTYTKVVKSTTSQLKLRNHQQFLLPNMTAKNQIPSQNFVSAQDSDDTNAVGYLKVT